MDCFYDLDRKLLSPLLCDLEAPLAQVVMEVSSLAQLNYYVVVGVTFKEVIEPD
jgi:hypothetical protein